MQGAWWSAIADALPKPWPEEAALFDLRWYADAVACGSLARVPGRPSLERRWGWSGYKVRRLVDAPERWRTPTASTSEVISPEVRQFSASSPPANRQPIASRSPADRQPIASNGDEEPQSHADLTSGKTSESPADRQRIASESPAKNQKFASSPPVLRQPPSGNVDAVVDPDALRKKKEERISSVCSNARAREGEPTLFPEPTPVPMSAEERTLLEVLGRLEALSRKPEGTARRWMVDPVKDRSWFVSSVLGSELGTALREAGVNVDYEILQWEAWCEDEHRRLCASQKSKFPKKWKTALRNWLTKAADRSKERHDGRGTQARGAYSQARVRQGRARQFGGMDWSTIKPRPAGSRD